MRSKTTSLLMLTFCVFGSIFGQTAQNDALNIQIQLESIQQILKVNENLIKAYNTKTEPSVVYKMSTNNDLKFNKDFQVISANNNNSKVISPNFININQLKTNQDRINAAIAKNKGVITPDVKKELESENEKIRELIRELESKNRQIDTLKSKRDELERKVVNEATEPKQTNDVKFKLDKHPTQEPAQVGVRKLQ